MNELAQLIDRFERWTGLDLRRGSSYAALERYVRLQLPANDPTALARYVEDVSTPHHPEAVRLVNAITVCHSQFYRDPDQLAGLIAVLRADTTRPANVWVPACATGEDPYTIAMICESIGRQVSIMATDINTRALAHATAGIYGPWSVRDLPPAMALNRRADGRYEVPDRIRRVVTFARHNLMDVTPSAADGWDVIVCRNVLMYLGRERVREVIQRLGAALRPGGYLFVGANDIFEKVPPPLRFVRIGGRHAMWREPPRTPGTSTVQLPVAGLLVTTIPPPLAGTPPALGTPSALGTPPALGTLAALGTPPAPGTPPAARPPTSSTPPAGVPALSPARPVGVPLSSTPPMGVPALSSASPAGAPAVSSARASARAHALMLEGNTAAALELVLAVLEADPLCVEAQLIAGIAYQLSGDAMQATTSLRAALVLAPDLWPAEMYLGFALNQLGDEPAAKRALRRGAQLAASADRLPLSPAVATWFEGWRVDAIELGRHAGSRGRPSSG